MQNDEGIRAVREVRKLISTECGNNPVRLVDRYVAQQKQYEKRLIRPVAVQESAAGTDSSASR